jgi:hypothetical protein
MVLACDLVREKEKFIIARHHGYILKYSQPKTVIQALDHQKRKFWHPYTSSLSVEPSIIIQKWVQNGVVGYKVFYGLVYPALIIIIHSTNRFFTLKPNRTVYDLLQYLIKHYNLHANIEFTLFEQSHKNWFTLCKDIAS